MKPALMRPGTSDITPLDLDQLDRLKPLRRIPGRNRFKADILVHRRGTLQLALKDYRARPWWVRHTFGRVLVARETAGYAAACGIPGVARFLGRLGPLTLATEWVEGRTLRSYLGQIVDPAILGQLREILDRLHGAGIALGDLNRRDVLIDNAGNVTLIDFATALVLGETPGALRARLHKRFLMHDEIAYARLRAFFSGEDTTRAVEDLGQEFAATHRRQRKWKYRVDRLRGRSHEYPDDG